VTLPRYSVSYEGPGQKYGEYRATYQYGHCRALKSPVAGYSRRFIHIRDKAPVTTGHGSLIAYRFGDHSLKLQGFIGIVALQGSSGLYSDRIDTLPYILHTFDRVLRPRIEISTVCNAEILPEFDPMIREPDFCYFNLRRVEDLELSALGLSLS
jgi:hypothetical protein